MWHNYLVPFALKNIVIITVVNNLLTGTQHILYWKVLLGFSVIH